MGNSVICKIVLGIGIKLIVIVLMNEHKNL